MPDDEPTHLLTVKFDYPEGSTFEDITAAMSAFRHAFTAYSRTSKAKLTVASFSGGSLNCALRADPAAIMGVQMMAQDFELLSGGHRAPLMPEAAKRYLRRALDLLESIDIDVEGHRSHLAKDATASLSIKAPPSSPSKVSKSGIVDRIDLKANQFRLMLANGYRVACAPCVPHLATISAAMVDDNQRLTVTGTAKFHGAGLLPSSIHVDSVSRSTVKLSLVDMVDKIGRDLEGSDVFERLAALEEEAEAKIDIYIRGGDA